MAPKRRKSRQRQNIYEIIKNNFEHPTVIWIYDQLRKNTPTVSLGNVYRNISILVEEGLIIKRDFADGQDHYDAVTDHHYHFVCEKCGKAIDFGLPIQENMNQLAQQNTRHRITGHTIQFYGICEDCMN